ncbi:Soluble lytic murein transglycosylase [Sphingomonas sp. YR710]|uniref:lytic transglycosylase domain-containing protein n=1 Tax=Sphingomonas sp. YR710 TaxID=1882773 RepID=UPI0008805A01|nr:lytic transglycosylase domain-containing protein [Sphingomonas sp. YR710]SDD69261.1 Soluble lytic murein transglycosylase [Sphingomonas sp. YR710]
MIRRLLITAALVATPTALFAQAAPVATAQQAVPAQLTPDQRSAYRNIFAAIRAGDWTTATSGLDALPNGPLTAVARAELILAKGSPKADDATLADLLTNGRDLPEAPQIARVAQARNLALPALPVARDLVRMAGPPKRQNARALRNDNAAAALAQQVNPLIRNDQPTDAEALVTARLADLLPEAQTQFLQRVAWSYYLTGDDTNAIRVATQARAGSGDWAVQADWVLGLAAWRAKDCDRAATAFDAVSARARDSEMMAAGLYWTARADMQCRRPDRIEPRLRSAARLHETFYGMLSQAALGISDTPDNGTRLTALDWSTIGALPNIRRAAALAEIDETALADQLLRYQARIGLAQDHESLIHLAARLNLPSTQIWLAQNGPSGSRLSASARYPTPAWTPASGWQVDRSLIFAHALQESQFRPDATSSAGARGVMQLMPGTAQMVARHQGRTIDAAMLSQPAASMELGQQYLRELAGNSGTAGLLPKVIAAYNAGPNSVANWNARGRNLADPLLFIESIPFTETRAYVTIVLRNYWMYQKQAGAKPGSLTAIAQGLWPKFPGLPGREAVRLSALGGVASAD